MSKQHLGRSPFYLKSSGKNDKNGPLVFEGFTACVHNLHDYGVSMDRDTQLVALLDVSTATRRYVINVGYCKGHSPDSFMEEFSDPYHFIKINEMKHPPYYLKAKDKFDLTRVIAFVDILLRNKA